MAKRRREVLAWDLRKTLKKTAESLQRLRRLEEADRFGMCVCVSCGTRKHWKEMEGGHFCSRSSNSVILVEDNIHTQCSGCNRFDTSTNSGKRYYEYMVGRYGQERVDEIIAMSRQSKKWDKEELLVLRDGYMDRSKDQLKRIENQMSQQEWRNQNATQAY